MAKRSKKYNEVLKTLPTEAVSLEEAIKLLPTSSTTKFDASCEIHFKLGIDPRQADQMIRMAVSLPEGTGKDVRVIAFCSDDQVKAAKAAGASEAGTEALVQKISEGWLEFDVAVAEPAAMKAIGKIAKTLGQKGLMPNPKTGTVGPEVAKMVEELKKGKVELRNDKTGNIHALIGKVSFGEDRLKKNIEAILTAIKEAKPATMKGVYIKSITLTTAMGPGIKVSPNA